MKLSIDGARQIFTKTHHSSDEPDRRGHRSFPKPLEHPVQVGNLGLGQKNSWFENILMTIFQLIFSRIGSLANANHRPGGGQVTLYLVYVLMLGRSQSLF